MTLKAAAASENAALAIVGAACWTLGAAVFVQLLKTNDLAIIAVLTASIGIVATVCFGVFAFGETLSIRQVIGIAVAMIGVVVISWPAVQ